MQCVEFIKIINTSKLFWVATDLSLISLCVTTVQAFRLFSLSLSNGRELSYVSLSAKLGNTGLVRSARALGTRAWGHAHARCHETVLREGFPRKRLNLSTTSQTVCYAPIIKRPSVCYMYLHFLVFGFLGNYWLVDKY